MTLVDWIVILVIAGIVGLAGWYVLRAKKKGRKCIGCPDSGTCSGSCSCCSYRCGKDA
jgi:hypothetical protein